MQRRLFIRSVLLAPLFRHAQQAQERMLSRITRLLGPWKRTPRPIFTGITLRTYGCALTKTPAKISVCDVLNANFLKFPNKIKIFSCQPLPEQLICGGILSE